MGRLLTKQNAVTSPSIVEVFAYDGRGLMTKAVKGDSSVEDVYSSSEMDYDGLGQLEESRQVVEEGNIYTLNYERDQLGQATKLYYPKTGAGVATIEYSYTSLGSIDTIDRGVTELADYDYYGGNVSDRLYSTTSNVSFTPLYDSFGRVTSHSTLNASSVGVDFTYSYDDNSNIVSKTFEHRASDPSNIYAYDTLNRVTRSDYHNSENELFTYDKLGNRDQVVNRDTTTDTYTNNNVNEYTEIVVDSSSKAPLYDAAGNLTKDINDYTYHYDYENRIIEIKKDNDTDLVAEYTYGALGRRIQVKDDEAADDEKYKRFYYDGNRVLLETGINDVLLAASETDERYFVYGNYIDEVLVMRDIGGSSDHYYGHDHLFSPTVLFSAAGAVDERYEYDAYGKCTVLDPDLTADADNKSDFANPYLFTGRRLDILDGSSLKLQYSRARYYDPYTGRFLQRDPLGINPAGGENNPFDALIQYTDGVNVFEYVNSSPNNGLDPYGNLRIPGNSLGGDIPGTMICNDTGAVRSILPRSGWYTGGCLNLVYIDCDQVLARSRFDRSKPCKNGTAKNVFKCYNCETSEPEYTKKVGSIRLGWRKRARITKKYCDFIKYEYKCECNKWKLVGRHPSTGRSYGMVSKLECAQKRFGGGRESHVDRHNDSSLECSGSGGCR